MTTKSEQAFEEYITKNPDIFELADMCRFSRKMIAYVYIAGHQEGRESVYLENLSDLSQAERDSLTGASND